MKRIFKISLFIGILANIYLGVIGLFQFDLLKYILKMNHTLLNLIYVIFGLCGIINILLYKKE